MVIKYIDNTGNIYYKVFDDYSKYLRELNTLKNDTLYEII